MIHESWRFSNDPEQITSIFSSAIAPKIPCKDQSSSTAPAISNAIASPSSPTTHPLFLLHPSKRVTLNVASIGHPFLQQIHQVVFENTCHSRCSANSSYLLSLFRDNILLLSCPHLETLSMYREVYFLTRRYIVLSIFFVLFSCQCQSGRFSHPNLQTSLSAKRPWLITNCEANFQNYEFHWDRTFHFISNAD